MFTVYVVVSLIAAAFVAYQAHAQRMWRLSFKAHTDAMELKDRCLKAMAFCDQHVRWRTQFRCAVLPVRIGKRPWQRDFRHCVAILVEREDDKEKIEIVFSQLFTPSEQERIEYRLQEKKDDDDRKSDRNVGAAVATDTRARRHPPDGEHLHAPKGA
jgi:hypothetical protein